MKRSAGLLVYRTSGQKVEVLLVHPGGPFWAKKDVWSIPKGQLDDGEDHLKAAFREFQEEVGVKPPTGQAIELGFVNQSRGKQNFIWAAKGEVDLAKFSCNKFTMEWPPKSGQMQEFPENDRAAWFDLATAKQKMFQDQLVFIDRLAEHLGHKLKPDPVQPTLF